MSEHTLKTILDEMVTKIPAACAAGTAPDLLVDFYRANARDLAEVVFLRLATLPIPPTEQEAEDYAAEKGLQLVKGVAEVHTANGFHRSDWTERAERATLTAYAERLLALISSSEGGSA